MIFFFLMQVLSRDFMTCRICIDALCASSFVLLVFQSKFLWGVTFCLKCTWLLVIEVWQPIQRGLDVASRILLGRLTWKKCDIGMQLVRLCSEVRNCHSSPTRDWERKLIFIKLPSCFNVMVDNKLIIYKLLVRGCRTATITPATFKCRFCSLTGDSGSAC